MAFDFNSFGTTGKPSTATSGGGFDFNSFGATTPTVPTVDTRTPTDVYLGDVGAQYQQGGQDVINALTQKPAYPGQTILRAAGAVANAAFAPITELPIVKSAMGAVAQKITQIPGATEAIQKASELATKYPNAAKDLGAVVGILSLGAGSGAVKEGKAIANDAVQGAKILLTPSEEAVQSKVVALFNKSIKPTPQKTVGLATRYENSEVNALKTIKDNAPNLNIEDASGELVSGRTPQTINELAQAVDQTKKTVFTQYDNLAKKAGGLGVQIDVAQIASELDTVINNKALQIRRPEIVKYAQNLKERLTNVNAISLPGKTGKMLKPATLDTQTIQELIQGYNSDLNAFYRNPTYDAASKVTIDAGVANNLRKALDSAIEGATGEQYQVLKNQYSALKAIENDVVRASIRDAKKNVKGLLDYTDIFTGGQMIGGLLSLNPAMFTKGAIERGFKEWIKFLNDPNRAVSNMFDALSQPTSFTPTSRILKSVVPSSVVNPK